EVTARPQRTIRSDGEGADRAVGVRVPARRLSGRRVDLGEVVARLAANRVEVTAGEDGRPGHGEGVNDVVGRVRVPARRIAGGRIEGGDAVGASGHRSR